MREGSVRSGAILTYVTIAVSIVTGVLITPWIVRSLGQSDYGLMTLANSLGALLAVDLGLSAATTKFVAKYRAENDDEQYAIFLRTVFTVFLVLDALVLTAFVLLWLFAGSIMVALSFEEVGKLRILLVIVGLQNVLAFPLTPVNGILAGNERFVSLKLGDLGMKLLAVAGMAACLLAGGGLNGVVVAGSVAVLVAFVFKLVRAWRLGLISFVHEWSEVPAQFVRVARFSVWTMVITVSQRISVGLAPTVIGGIAGSASVAVFGVAAMLEGYVWLVANAVNGLFLARVTRFVAAGPSAREALMRLAVRVGRFQLVLLGLLYLGFVFAGRDFVTLWLGKGFDGVYVIALCLIAPALVVNTQEVFRSMLISTDKIRWSAVGSVIAAVISLPMALVLIPRWGGLGAGVAIAVANVVGLVVFMNGVYVRLGGYGVRRFFTHVHISLLPALLVAAGLFWGVDRAIPGVTWTGLLLKVAVMLTCYCCAMYVVGLNHDERHEIKMTVTRR